MSKPPHRFWDEDDKSDSFEKYSKIRKREKGKSRASDLTTKFEVPESQWEINDSGGYFAARVVEVHKRYAFVSLEANFVCVGDRVLCRPALEDELASTSELPQCMVEALAPRRTRLARRDPMTPEREHVLCSNVDQLAIVASFLMPQVKWGLIDRYLVLAESEEIRPIIVLNKRDLLEEDSGFRAKCAERIGVYQSLGYEVYCMQANAKGATRDPVTKELAAVLKGKITAFSGHSGVGKSSIINLFKPELVQAVEPDEEILYKGRHTTSYASFLKLGGGGYVIDTPGIRSFLIREDSPINLTHCFVEMRPFLGKCAFRECRHVDEPNCMVMAAVESGKISGWRYKSYLGLLLGTTGRQGRTRDLAVEEP